MRECQGRFVEGNGTQFVSSLSEVLADTPLRHSTEDQATRRFTNEGPDVGLTNG